MWNSIKKMKEYGKKKLTSTIFILLRCELRRLHIENKRKIKWAFNRRYKGNWKLVIGLWCEIFADFHGEEGLLREKRRILKRSKHIRCPWNWKYRPASLGERAKSLLYNPGILTSRIPFLATSLQAPLKLRLKTQTTFFFETIDLFQRDKTR